MSDMRWVGTALVKLFNIPQSEEGLYSNNSFQYGNVLPVLGSHMEMETRMKLDTRKYYSYINKSVVENCFLHVVENYDVNQGESDQPMLRDVVLFVINLPQYYHLIPFIVADENNGDDEDWQYRQPNMSPSDWSKFEMACNIEGKHAADSEFYEGNNQSMLLYNLILGTKYWDLFNMNIPGFGDDIWFPINYYYAGMNSAFGVVFMELMY
jgi:hypothetical protein